MNKNQKIMEPLKAMEEDFELLAYAKKLILNEHANTQNIISEQRIRDIAYSHNTVSTYSLACNLLFNDPITQAHFIHCAADLARKENKTIDYLIAIELAQNHKKDDIVLEIKEDFKNNSVGKLLANIEKYSSISLYSPVLNVLRDIKFELNYLKFKKNLRNISKELNEAIKIIPNEYRPENNDIGSQFNSIVNYAQFISEEIGKEKLEAEKSLAKLK